MMSGDTSRVSSPGERRRTPAPSRPGPLLAAEDEDGRKIVAEGRTCPHVW